MTELERDVATLREACESLARRDECLGALDRLVVALRHEQEAKQAAIERWRARAQAELVALSTVASGPEPSRSSRQPQRPRRSRTSRT